MARRVAVVPHTHWDREWYSPFQTFRLRLVDLLDDLLPRLEADPVLRALPARRADGGGRRLPRGPSRGRGASPPPRGQRPRRHGAVVHPHGRVPRLGRDDRPRPAARPRPRRRVRRRDGGRLPARHVRPHRADAAAPAAVRLRPRGRVARRARVGRPHRVLVVEPRRQHGAGRVPARPATATAPPCPTTPRACSSDCDGWIDAQGSLIVPTTPDLDHERHRPPRSAGVPRAGGRRGERAAGRLRPRGHVAGRRTSRTRHATGCRRGRASCARAPAPTS